MRALYQNLTRIQKENELRERTARHALLDALIAHFKLDDDPAIGVHKCIASPIGVCVYDPENDFNHDSCLVCGYPHERK